MLSLVHSDIGVFLSQATPAVVDGDEGVVEVGANSHKSGEYWRGSDVSEDGGGKQLVESHGEISAELSPFLRFQFMKP